MTYHQNIFFLCAGLTAVMSLITMIAFFSDKHRAVKGKRRIPEKTLLALTASFGALGAMFGRELASHKINKGYFAVVIAWSMLLNAALLAFTAYEAFFR